MKAGRPKLTRSFLIIFLILFFSKSFSQTFTPIRTTGMGSNVVGYYEYLPIGYNDPANAGKKYPTIFYLHGAGELGSTGNNNNNLEVLKNNALPRVIAIGDFPATFTVNNQNYSFIIICPMFKVWYSGDDVSGTVDYILSRPSTYRVDSSMIYMSGFSLGGGKTWEYLFSSQARSMKMAAALPDAAYCTNPALNLNNAVNVARGGTAIWALHNPQDATANSTTCCVNLVNKVNSFSPIIPAKYTVACVGDPFSPNDCGHTGWNTIFDPKLYTLPGSGGLNVYQWFLTQKRGVVTPPPPPNNPPVANAGPDQNITMPANATLVGSGSDPEGGRVTFSWAKVVGPPGSSLVNATAATATATGLIAGVYQFELTVTDSAGAKTRDTAKVTVINPNPNVPPLAKAGLDINISLPASSTGLTSGGSLDPDGSIIGYSWTKISGPASYSFNDSTLASPTVSNLKTGIYQFELTVTDNQGGIGKDTVKVTLINPFPNKLPVARAGSDQQLILPSSNTILDGSLSSDSDGMIVSYLWTKIGGPAGYIISNPNSATTTISGLGAGVYLFELKVTDDSSGVGRDTVKVTLSSTQRILVDFGISTLTTASPDANGNYWNNVTDTRPGNQLVNAISTSNTPTTLSLQVINRIDGTFSPSGTGTNGTNTTGIVSDYPANATNDFAFAHSSTTTGKWRIFGLDSTKSYTMKFWGSKSAVSGRIIQIKRSDQTTWQSYDAGANTDYNRAAVFTVSGLTEVSFDIQVQSGTFGYINVMDISYTSNGNQPPVAKAGNDITVTLPQDTVLLNGSGSLDPDGSIAKYKWRKITGPPAGGIAGNDSIPNPVVRNLAAGGAGTYSFELKVTDNGGLTGLDTVNVVVQNSGANQPPVAKAGIDISITQPTDSTTLNGSSSFDSDGSITGWQWVQISGPGTVTIVSPNSAFPGLKGLAANAGTYAFQLTVTDNQGATGKDTVQVIENPFPFTPPTVTDVSNCGKSFKIVVLGSSTAVGTGASPIDSSWVRKFTSYVKSKNSQNNVVNLALGGATTYEILNPTGFTPPGGRPAPDTAHNITKALSLNPDAIIINLPSNDAAAGYSVVEQKANYERTMALANQNNIPVWVATAQPRNLTTQAARDSLKALRDWIFTRFGGKAVDFWTTVANTDGTIIPFFDAGDGTHVNNFGHHIFYVRMVGETILDSLCVITNKPPVANAGHDTTITLPASTINLNGSSSADPDGSIALYRWRKISGPAPGTIVDTTAINTTATGLTNGQYQFELRVVDNQGKTGRDTMTVTVNPANIPPVAKAGKDTLIISPANSVMLDGSASSDPDGTIAAYSWKLLSGPNTYTIDDSTLTTPTISNLVIGTYQLQLTVTDNKGATGKDTVNVFVNPVPNILPVAKAGNDTTITLPPGTAILDGSASSDADGTISSYRWRKVSGAGGTIADTTAVQTSVTGLTAGTYQFALIVTDNVGGIGRDTMVVTVNNPPNNPPIAVAGNDTLITLPANVVSLKGNQSTDSDGSISSYRWKKISGPASGTIVDTTAAQTTATGMVAGTYQFELTVTDNLGAKGRDTMSAIVNQPPVANAGTNTTITLPVNSVQLIGTGSSDPDGSIMGYLWAYVSGPTTYTLNSNALASPTLSGLVQGTYVFRLTVTDNRGATASAQVTITVNTQVVAGARTRVLIDAGPSTSTTSSPDAWGKYWNNMTDGRAGVRVNNALDTANRPTTVSIEVINRIDGTYATAYPGTNGGNTTGIVGDYPASATNDFIFAHESTTTGKWRLFGLDTATTYNVKFWGSKSYASARIIRIKRSDQTTWQSYDGQLNTDYNRAAVFTVTGLTEVSFDIQVQSGTFGYINVIDIVGVQNQSGLGARSSYVSTQSQSMMVQPDDITVNQAELIDIYPNPVKSNADLMIQNNYHGLVRVKILNQYGKALKQITMEKVGGDLIQNVPMNDLPKGIYFIQLQFGLRMKTVKFVKY